MIPAHVFETIVNNLRDAVVIVAPSGRLLYANAAARKMFELGRRSDADVSEIVSQLQQQESTVKYRTPSDDRVLWLNCHQQEIEIEGECCSLITCRDITFEKQRERRLQKEATTDFLSGLSNRREFHKMLLANCDRPICVAVIDVDHFKQINDQHGHLIGDAAIRFVAEQMLKSFFDAICVARLGGEEFGVIVDASVEDATVKFDSFLTTIERCSFSEHDIPLTVSIGVAVSNEANDAYSVLECADKAVYESKNLGRNRLTVFELRRV